VAQQLGLDQRRGQGGAVDLDEGPGLARAALVDRLGQELLSGPGLAEEEDRARRGRHLRDALQNAAERRAAAHDVREVAAPDLLAQVDILLLELVLEGADLLELEAQLLLAALAVHRVRDDLADQASPVDRFLVPGPVLAKRPGGEGAHVAAPDSDRHAQVRLHSGQPRVLAFALRVRGQIVGQTRERDGVASCQRADVPRHPRDDRRRRGRQAFPGPGMGHCQAAVGVDQVERASVGAQQLDEEAQRPRDLPVHGLDGQACEPGRQVRNQATEGGLHSRLPL
jgi:hypothetical protein